jgi:hypothetical protein
MPVYVLPNGTLTSDQTAAQSAWQASQATQAPGSTGAIFSDVEKLGADATDAVINAIVGAVTNAISLEPGALTTVTGFVTGGVGTVVKDVIAGVVALIPKL